MRRALEQAGLPIRTIRPTEIMASCPVHGERTGSMHVTWKDDPQGGKVVLYCHGCEARGDDIAEALGLTLADLFDEPLPERDRTVKPTKTAARRLSGQRRGRLGRLPALLRVDADSAPGAPLPVHDYQPVTTYAYTDLEGKVVQEVVRHECTCDGTRHKEFRQAFVTATGQRVHRKPAGFAPVLYNARAVAEAIAAGREIYLVEGEKDADVATSLGLVATTNAQGGRSFPDELIPHLEGSKCRIVLDRDPTGWARGVDLHAKLKGKAEVTLLLPAVTGDKTDFADHIEAGYTPAGLDVVHVEEVATWHAYAAVAAKERLVHQAIEQARAQAALETEEGAARAKRWTLEAQIRHEDLLALVAQVQVHGRRVGTVWAVEAMDLADVAQTTTTDFTRRLHLDLGVAIPPSLQLPSATTVPDLEAGTEQLDSPSGDHPSEPESEAEQRWGGGAGARARKPGFRVLDGQIVQWEPERGRSQSSSDDDDAEGAKQKGTWKPILSMVVRVTTREFLEVGSDLDALDQPELMGRAPSDRRQVAPPRTLVAVRVAYTDPASGQPMEIRVMADQWRDHSWLDSLPGPPDYDHKRAGLDTLQRAVLAISDGIRDEVLHRSTGWRDDGEGVYRYVHRRGAITATGHVDGEVALAGPMERYDLPDPTTDVSVLRSAWLEGSLTMLDRLPERIAGPLLGHAFRAAMGHNPWVMALIGPPGSYKTSVAAKVMHHYGERWEHSKPSSSMSGNGDTLNAMRLKLHHAKDVLYWFDDFAPTKSWVEAQKLLEETARLVHNQEERSRSSRDGQSLGDGTGPRASALFTSEVMPRPGSASERMLVIPIAREDVDTSLLFPLDEALSRHQRALVTANFVRWLATDLRTKRDHYRTVAADYADQLTGRGETVRQSQAVASTWAGWVAITDMLVDVTAITDAEQVETLTRIDFALAHAARAAINPDMPRTTGARVTELLGYALRNGLAYVDDIRTGDCPDWPLAGRLGWRQTVTEREAVRPDEDPRGLGTPLRVRVERQGIRLGYVCHDPGPRDTRGRVIMCDSTQLEAVLKVASGTQAEKLEIDRNTACRALHEEGVLIADTSEGRTRHTVKCSIFAEGGISRRMVVLNLDAVIGDERPDDPTPPEPPVEDPDPQPLPPAPLPGLTPHSVDATADSGHDDSSVTTDRARPHQPEEDIPMDDTPTDQSAWPDLDGVDAQADPNPEHVVKPCIVCGQRCVVIIDGVHIHYVCWRSSNTTMRQAARGDTAPRPAAPDRRARATGTFRAAAAVATIEGLWLSNGEHLRWPYQVEHVGQLHDIANDLQLGTQVTPYRSASSQMWISDDLASALGIDIDRIKAAEAPKRDTVAREITQGAPAVVDALDAGYRLGGREGDSLGRWTRIWRGTGNSTFLVLMAALTDNPDEMALIVDDPDPETLARRIGRLATHLRHPYQLSPGTTGLDLLTALRWKDRESFLAVREPIPPALRNTELEISWCRIPDAEEQQHQWVHAYDRGGSHLVGASGLELGVGDPTHHPEGCVFVPKKPGYWYIEVPENGDWRAPNPLDPTGEHYGRQRWVTTPGLEFALEQGYDPTILEAYTWPTHARVLDPWYEVMRDARMALDTANADDQIARDQLKQVYVSTIGMLGSHTFMSGRPGYAPDWRHHIVAKARTNILRRVATIGRDTGRWPVAITTDTVIYTSPEADPLKAWPGGERWFGRELGRYKHEGTASLESQMPFLAKGGKYAGKDALMDSWREATGATS